MKKTRIDSNYIYRCHKALRALRALLSGWYCDDVIDWTSDSGQEDYAICELCSCTKVRFVHVMRHDEYDGELRVGCICAGVMEDDLAAAKAREREVKNRSKRREKFADRKWAETSTGNFYLKVEDGVVFINRTKYNYERFGVSYKDRKTWYLGNKPIDSFTMATKVAYDMVYPAKGGME